MTRFTTSLLVAASLASISTSASAHAVRPHQPPPPDLSEELAPPPIDTPHFARPIDVPHRRPVPTLDRATLRAALAAARAKNLAAFHTYVTTGIYPSNVYTHGALNVWRDEDGHFCAAATIIRQSGATALVDKVADQNNNIRLADVTQGPLMNWILTSGLTQSEIALIQRPFMPVTEKPQPTPVNTVAINARMRARETARLRALYAQIEKSLARQQNLSLDRATDLLINRPQLAWPLIAG